MWKGIKMRKEMIISYEIIDGMKTGMKNEGEIIRCRECAYHDLFFPDLDKPQKKFPICMRNQGFIWNDNEFCLRAKRREE